MQNKPIDIFFALVKEGLIKNGAESFGKTVGLDILNLYEQAADSYFQEGSYGLALEFVFDIYKLLISNQFILHVQCRY